MRRFTFVPVLALALIDSAPHGAPAPIVVNDNRVAAGTLANGVLTIRLEIREGEWHPDADSMPGMVMRAFGEAGKPAAIPGPLIRVPEGTVIHAFVHNTLTDSTIVVRGLSTRGTAVAGEDTIVVRPGATREVSFPAGRAGT